MRIWYILVGQIDCVFGSGQKLPPTALGASYGTGAWIPVVVPACGSRASWK